MKNKKKLFGIVAGAALIILIITLICVNLKKSQKAMTISTPELARVMNYEQFEEGDEAIDNTDNVKFSAFFLRDLDEDGYAEKIKGTCRPIGGKDTLYMEINVQTEGYLKDAKVEIAGKNFSLQTILPKDEQFKNDYIGNNTKVLEFNELNNGTQKLFSGVISSVIGNNINDYSREDNKIILTGTYVGEDGKEVEIRKEVPLTVDWYGTTSARISNTYQTNYNLPDTLDEENGQIVLSFYIETYERDEILNLSRNYIEGTIPELNGYAPIEVKMINTTSENLTFQYDKTSKIFMIDRTATVSEDGTITTRVSRENTYTIQVTYPLEAYQLLGEETVSISVPVKTYYEGYNNPNEEFNNPYQSNEEKGTITARFLKPVPTVAGKSSPRFDITVGKYIYYPEGRYIVSKNKPLRIYNGISEEEKEDTYIVRWYAYTGTDGDTTGLVMKETKTGESQVSDEFITTDASTISMESITSNVGIYFAGAEKILKEDGWIKVYDEETDNLLVTFTKDNWNEYTPNNPYKYELPVKHIRIETSETNKLTSLLVYNIKELDDEYITTNYTREEYDNLKYIKSTLNAYLGGNYVETNIHQAKYEEPYSLAKISISNTSISTQATEEHQKIIIDANYNSDYNQIGWIDGSFLVKLPEEILSLEINSVQISNSNVTIQTYELIENEHGKFIKINTKNNNDKEQSYTITIDTNMTPDPRKATQTREIELYATNVGTEKYYNEGQDIYDVNNNLNKEEAINKDTTSIQILAPTSLLTNQTASEYDPKNSMVISPQIAEIVPRYAKVDNEKQTVKIGVQLRNNYASTVSDVVILGKIPFKGNKTVISGKDLKSEFTTKMVETGIEIPEELQGKVTVYYSENENPDKELTKTENGWTLGENVSNWDNIKTFLIDFKDETILQGVEYTFYYKVEIPEGTEFNKTTFSHHGIYFSLDTEAGKYRTKTEPNKLGFRIVEKFNLEIIKTQKGKDKLVSGATYSIKEILEDGTVGETKTEVTNENGSLLINNLYALKTYEIQEIKTPNDYELNSDIIRFVGHVSEDGTLTIEKLQGSTKEDITVTKNNGEKHKVTVKVEDEAKAKLKITKREQGTDIVLSYVRYRMTGAGLPEKGKILTTNANGEINISSLKINEEYIVEEIKTKEGYYLGNYIKFKIVNNEGAYELQVIEGTALESNITEENCLPTANLILENEKIPRYTLKINKIKKVLETEITNQKTEENTTEEKEVVYLEGAKFRLYKDEKVIGTYITDANGKIVINDLYQYIEGKDEKAIYTLKEIEAPSGYTRVKDITFKVENKDGALELINIEGNTEKNKVEGTTVSLTIEDNPSFRLIKKDAETGERLANVKFAIYNVDNGEVPATNSKNEIIGTLETINGKGYYTITTDANGVITADLPEGYYKAVEVQAPDKYDIETSTYYFGIGGSTQGAFKLKEEWTNKITGDGYKNIESIIKTNDGGYLIEGEFSGYSIELENGDRLSNKAYVYDSEADFYINTLDSMLIKYSNSDEIEWAKSIGGHVSSALQTRDGGYIIVGGFYTSIDAGDGVTLTSNYGTANWDGMIIKYDTEGVAQWADHIGGYYNESIDWVIETEDGGYIVEGNFYDKAYLTNGTTLTGNGRGDEMLIKYSAEGYIEWAKAIGGSGQEEIKSLVKTSDGGCIITGRFNSSNINLGNEVTLTNNSSDYNGMIIKYSADGVVQWAKRIGEIADDYIESVEETSDGGFIVGGHFQSNSIDVGNGVTLTNNGFQDGMIVKYDSNGSVEWAKALGENEYDGIVSVAQTSDGGYIVGGYFNGSSIDIGNGIILNNSFVDGTEGMLIKYSQEGVAQWAKSTRGKADSISETSDGGYILRGSSRIKKYNSEGTQELDTNIDFNISSITEIRSGQYIFGGNKSVGYDEWSEEHTYEAKLRKYILQDVSRIDINQAVQIGGTYTEEINSVVETRDGGYIVGGYFDSNSIELGNGVILTSNGYTSQGMLIKYSVNSEVEWAKAIGEKINSIAKTRDGGYIVGGQFGSTSIDLGNGIILSNTSDHSSDGMLIKYSEEGVAQWAKAIGGTSDDTIISVVETRDGGYIVGGQFDSRSIDLENGVILANGANIYSADGMMIKYTSKGEIEWAKSIGGPLNSISETSDGGYIVGGDFYNSEYSDGKIIKYSADGVEEWVKQIAGSIYNSRDSIKAVAKTIDGGYLVGGQFAGQISLGNGITLGNTSDEYEEYPETQGIVIKYSADGVAEWAKSIGSYSNVNAISETRDGGFIVAGNFGIIKYNILGEEEGSKNNIGNIYSVIQTKKGDYIVAGTFYGNLNLGNGDVLINSGYDSNDGLIMKISVQKPMKEVQELIIENERKEFKITTNVKEIDGIKGGIISGEDTIYEIVKYGDSNTKEIVMTPDENYEIIRITVNGQEHIFTANVDGSYTMPVLENITEDKQIEVTYSLKDNKIIINKVDREIKEPLAGATFKLDQLEEREEPENVIGAIVNNGQEYAEADLDKEVTGLFGELTDNGEAVEIIVDKTKEATDVLGEMTDNGQSYGAEVGDKANEVTDVLGEMTDNGQIYGLTVKTDKTKEITGVLGELTNNGTYYFSKQDGKYESNNQGKAGTVANSYMKIDLTQQQGQYAVVVNANCSSENNYDYGYATITESTTAPAYNSTIGQFIYISGTVASQDYTSSILEGGKTYYLHLGYRKDGSSDQGNDQIVFNSVNVYEAASEGGVRYNFIQNEGKYESNNQGKAGTVANSYMKIDLSDKQGTYAVVVNANISSGWGDYGYATITEDTIAPSYDSRTGRFISITGDYNTTSPTDYTSIALEGGKTYYLHFGYYKYQYSRNFGEDKFTINSVNAYEAESLTYEFIENEGKYESNNQGKSETVANSYMKIDLSDKQGTYAVVVNANVSSSWEDYGYATITESTERPSYDSRTGRFIYISGRSETTLPTDYTSSILEGGKIYYLHFGYYKFIYNDHYGDDKFTINSVNVYEAEPLTYEFIENEGKYESNNQGQCGTTANSYIPIDLTNKEGTYVVVVNAEISSGPNYDGYNYGYATITENTNRPSVWDNTGRFIHISETVAAQNYTSMALEGGKTYYLHLGYMKDRWSSIEGEDKFTINSVNLYEAKTVTYGFVENESKYETTIQGRNNRTANSYIPIDLTNYEGKYNLIVNANISSEQWGDIGYATVKEDTARPEYYDDYRQIIYISGTEERVTTPTDYTTILEGGKLYYLHLGYYKNGAISEGDDKFTINSIEVKTNGDHLYHTEVTTNSEGKAITQIPFGKYAITETVAPEGYELNENSVVVEFRADGNHEFTIENNKLAKVIVHHYIKGTTTKVAEDDILQDKAGYPYLATPKLDLEEYELEKDVNGENIIPTNVSGQYVSGEQEVIYYYINKQIPLVINHYIEGTGEAVPLLNGEKAQSVTIMGKVGDSYTTTPIPESELGREYELVETPRNNTGIYKGDKVEVTYYYKKIARKVIINKYGEDGKTPLEGAVFTIVDKKAQDNAEPKQYTTNSKGKIEVVLQAGEYIITEIQAPKGYQLPENPKEEISITREKDEVSLNITNIEQQGKVIVQHYLEGTEKPVTLLDGTPVQDIIKIGTVGDMYATAVPSNIDTKYELVIEPVNASGNITKEQIVVTYYYRLKDTSVVVHHYKEGTEESLSEDITINGKVDDEYTTEPAKHILDVYEVVEEPENKSGLMTEEQIIVTYYYRLRVANISVNKSVEVSTGKNFAIEGNKITYTVTISNSGTLGKDVVVKDTIPTGTTFVEGSIKIDGKAQDITTEELANGITINVPMAENGETSVRTLSFEVTVDEGTTGDITNTAIVDNQNTNEVKVPIITYEKEAKITRRKEESTLGEKEVSFGDKINYVIKVHNTGTVTAEKIEIKDTIPVGTIVKTIEDGGVEKSKEITWIIEKIQENTTAEVGFTVEVQYSKEEYTINNKATVEGKETNEIQNPYKKPEVKVESTVVKKGTEKVVSKDMKVYYEIEYTAKVEDFEGKAKVTIVDKLPYAIDKENSNIANGKYDEKTKTITWIEDITNINTFVVGQEREINITKVLELSYKYEDIDNTSGSMENKVTTKIELQEPKTNSPSEYDAPIKVEEKEATKVTLIEIPAKVIVHHYMYDEVKNEYTTVKVVESETVEGIIGGEYKTVPSSAIPANYRAVSTTPEKYEGKMTAETIEVIYYYQVVTPIVENTIEKTATANKKDANQIAVLTKEDGVVTYDIKYNVTIQEYIGTATVEMVDTLPAEIDLEKSDLAGGEYNSETKTISWTESLEINTFTNGVFSKNIVKQIKIVYKNQDVTKDLVNTVEGKVKVYYPDNHISKPGEEQVTNTANDEEKLQQEYKVNLKVEKEWEDNNNLKGKRPESVTIVITGKTNEEPIEKILNAENEWKCEITDLPKYDAEGNKIEYKVTERETKERDLEYYDAPVIMRAEYQTEEVTNYVFLVRNAYKLLNTDLKAEITKIGSEEIKTENQEVEYTINVKAEIIEYIGGGKIKIVDTLPYKIDQEKSDLANGTYNDIWQTITWEEELPHINTEISGENYKEDITKQIKVVYKDIDLVAENMTNKVSTKVELYESEVKDEKETTYDTKINVDGKVIVKYIDMDTGEHIDPNYTYEIVGKIGRDYTAEKKEIENYEYVGSTNNETGRITKETQEVIYYYTRIKTSVLVKYQDAEGNELAEDVLINGQVLDEYKAEAKEIENYRVLVLPDNREGIMTIEPITVIYIYEKIPTKVIVKYIYRDIETGEEKELLEAETIEGLAGDEYITERKVITNYKASEPEPTNKTGKMTPEPIEVKYYYEKIPSGVITVKYVDIDTEEELTYKSGEEELTYREEIKGFIGDEYTTKEKEIPYYVFTKNTENAKGILSEEGDTVKYYYKKQNLDFSVEKTIKEINLNGKKVRVRNDKLAKIEIRKQEIEETEIIITYEIAVKNEGEIKGTATITEIVPQGYEVIEKEERWQEKEGILETKVELDVGEKEEITIKQKWESGSENLGNRTNSVQISEIENIPNFEDTTIVNNISTAAVIVSVNSGGEANIGEQIIVPIIIATSMYAMSVLIITIRKEKLKKK